MRCTAPRTQSPAPSTYRWQQFLTGRQINRDMSAQICTFALKIQSDSQWRSLCWWVNLLHCLCHSSIQGTNLILFHLQRSSGVRRWVALRKAHTHTHNLIVKSLWRTRQHSLTHQMKFQNKRLSCDLQFSSGAEKSEKTFQSVPPPLLCCYESAV